jgi:hypothetical protein
MSLFLATFLMVFSGCRNAQTYLGRKACQVLTPPETSPESLGHSEGVISLNSISHPHLSTERTILTDNNSVVFS